MIVCTVHEPPDPPADRIDRAERFVFVRDGFHWVAFLATPLWLLWKRLWIPLAVFLGVVLAVAFSVDAFKVDPRWATFFGLALQAVAGFEAGSLARWGLDRRGWRTVGTVTGRNRADCERQFFSAWLPSQPAVAMADPRPVSAPKRGWWVAPWEKPIGRGA